MGDRLAALEKPPRWKTQVESVISEKPRGPRDDPESAVCLLYTSELILCRFFSFNVFEILLNEGNKFSVSSVLSRPFNIRLPTLGTYSEKVLNTSSDFLETWHAFPYFYSTDPLCF